MCIKGSMSNCKGWGMNGYATSVKEIILSYIIIILYNLLRGGEMHFEKASGNYNLKFGTYSLLTLLKLDWCELYCCAPGRGWCGPY